MKFRDRSFRFGSVVLLTLGINLCFPELAATKPKNSQNLLIEITGLRNQEGLVCLALFENSAGFPTDKTKAIEHDCFEITASPLQITLKQIPYGRYALSVLHDENQDRELDKGFLGIPKEGIGFSQNPRIKRKLPFEKSSFEFVKGSSPLEIQIKYF